MLPGRLTLSYGTTRVGYIHDAFEPDATWFGPFVRAISPDDGSLARSLLEFIEFCEGWNERTIDNPTPPDASEFDSFSDLLTSGLWTTTSPDGAVRRIREAPVFFKGDEVTWSVE